MSIEKEIILNLKKSKEGSLLAQKFVYQYAYTKFFISTAKYAQNIDDRITIFNNAMVDIFRQIRDKDINTIDGLVVNTIKWRGMDYLREKYKHSLVVNYYENTVELSTETTNIEIVENDEQIEGILNKLPQKEREVFVLFEFDNMSHDEISQTLKISIAYSKWLLYNAKKILRSFADESNNNLKTILI
jgi:RNA polymerase sigma factor (sigma-70 family)